jgi:hypothetical protein
VSKVTPFYGIVAGLETGLIIDAVRKYNIICC